VESLFSEKGARLAGRKGGRRREVTGRIQKIGEVVDRLAHVMILLKDGLEPELQSKAFGELRRLSLRLVLAIWMPISPRVKGLSVGDAWVALHSFEVGQFYIEELCAAVEENYRSFVAGAGEAWQIVGIFGSAEEAADAITAWMRKPSAKRTTRESAIS
jgi:hypothetical protein